MAKVTHHWSNGWTVIEFSLYCFIIFMLLFSVCHSSFSDVSNCDSFFSFSCYCYFSSARVHRYVVQMVRWCNDNIECGQLFIRRSIGILLLWAFLKWLYIVHAIAIFWCYSDTFRRWSEFENWFNSGFSWSICARWRVLL